MHALKNCQYEIEMVGYGNPLRPIANSHVGMTEY